MPPIGEGRQSVIPNKERPLLSLLDNMQLDEEQMMPAEVTDFVVPVLQICGISDENINKIMVKNPARILSF